MTTRELAESWGISPQRVCQLIARLQPEHRPRRDGRTYRIDSKTRRRLQQLRRPLGRPRSSIREHR